MRKINHNKYGRVSDSRFSPMLFAVYFVVLLLMSGIHAGLLVFMRERGLNEAVQSIVPIIYWGMIAVLLTLYARREMRRTYEEPMHMLAEATKKVADGDFSVYVPALHTADKLDYLDIMILDFNKMVEELGSVETLKTDFISNVSHEMKTPLAIIRNYAELLQKENMPKQQRKEYAKSIEGAAVRLSDLIGNILKLNKLENQRITPDREMYDVCRQLCECILQFEEVWDEKEIELETEIEDAAMIRADWGLMELVWNNLLSNAAKFTQPGGRVAVRQSSDEKQITISVSDTGCGISSESMDHIFDKFYQGDASHGEEGNGLGLALVKQVLELMDGDIQVVSEEGKGSTFTVALPMAGIENRSRGGL
ncbi:MAG: HAMP domain-containing histidine kinase [Lachnospiraceae bacterium]|nr:HAMP domain-containing histidine kinase [Lachnospiraceae bacterium]